MSLNAIVFHSLSTKEYEAFSNVSVLDVHTENGSFFKTPKTKINEYSSRLGSIFQKKIEEKTKFVAKLDKVLNDDINI